jgi:DNA-binding IclR family transcriptional regulator
MRLSLISRALGRAYLACCPKGERQLLVRMLSVSMPRTASRTSHICKLAVKKIYRCDPHSSPTRC